MPSLPRLPTTQTERYNFLAQLNRHLAANVLPAVENAYKAEVLPAFQRRHGRDPVDRREVRRALERHRLYRTWSALRRNTMEMRQQAGLSVVLGQLPELVKRAAAPGSACRLRLDRSVRLPDYLTAVDHHCMPGSYYTERVAGDVSAAANYDSGLFVTTGGLLGPFADGGGHGMVAFIPQAAARFRAAPHPGPWLRARTQRSAGRTGVSGCTGHRGGRPQRPCCATARRGRPVSGSRTSSSCRRMPRTWPGSTDASFDWVQSIMFLHETSLPALRQIMAESRRLVAPGGLVTHVEQPRYDTTMPLLEQALRDWDALYNNEPFWTKLHEVDLDELLVNAGFDRRRLIHAGVHATMNGRRCCWRGRSRTTAANRRGAVTGAAA